jgi:transposase InsO family protein
LADLILVDELERKPIGRPWLTLVIDVSTRMIAGFHLSLDAPSATSVALAISHAVLPKTWLQSPAGEPRQWPIAGLPLIVHLDNAKEFHSLALERGCREHGISLKFRPPLRPHFGGHIERLIGTLWEKSIFYLAQPSPRLKSAHSDFECAAAARVVARQPLAHRTIDEGECVSIGYRYT